MAGLATPDEVADYLKIPKRTLDQWRYLGIGPKSVRVGRHCRYRWADVERWLAEHERGAA
ncbi:helix-turn-helix domain-containing protein [Streptomyces sp. DT2A-34]|uniref:helix-turn-helix transcriptional regulator n=1 Tax=Streptomyces sp. DT2A-34 TaxID=3051182 RepID=UPI00265C20F2|nr:helix-turn-helix domain-containing protein [Streptomyces sp. DT2A-34]MDO0914620.1 helix-turn-helix domain-containing protein [Streptomyces sp. DT2A-34]